MLTHIQTILSICLRLKMDFVDDGLFFGDNSMTENSDPHSFSLDNEHYNITELQPAAIYNCVSFTENDKNNVRNLLEGWNMGFLFQTCLGEYLFITLIAAIIYSVSDKVYNNYIPLPIKQIIIYIHSQVLILLSKIGIFLIRFYWSCICTFKIFW